MIDQRESNMTTEEKALAGRKLAALILEAGGRVPRDEMGDLALKAGYARRGDWGGFLNGEAGLCYVPFSGQGIVTFQPKAWAWIAGQYEKLPAALAYRVYGAEAR